MDRGLPPHLRAIKKQQQQSTNMSGKITKAVNAEPRIHLPVKVQDLTAPNTSSSPWSSERLGNKFSNAPGHSGVKSTTESWNAYAGQAPSSKPSTVRQQPPPKITWEQLVAAQISDPDEYAGEASSVVQQRAPQESLLDMQQAQLPSKATAALMPTTMNAGKIAKSAKHDSKVSCTYEDCTRGFIKEADMKRHKDEDHDWCRLCNVDCADDTALLEHKVLSEMHICCDVCGEDFRSENGEERHMRQMHAKMQEVKCPACSMIFEKGSALIDHIYNNRCRDRRGFIAEKVNQNIIREYRATAALHLDAISNRPSTTSQEIAAMQPQSERDTSFVDNSEGGVRVNLMDDYTPYGHLTARDMSRAGVSSLSDVDSTIASNGTERPNFDEDLLDMSGDLSNGNVAGSSVIEGLQALRMQSPSPVVPEKQAWAAKLFPGAKPTPVTGGWTAPVRNNFCRNIWVSEVGSELGFRTDWDNMQLDRDPVDGMYHCPFRKCVVAYNELDGLKIHLASGRHQGTDNRCIKCLKVFKSPAALTAHMESNSERCKVRDTNAYGHILHVVSGGFLKVVGRHADGSIKVEAPTMEEIEEQMRNDALPPHLDEDYPW